MLSLRQKLFTLLSSSQKGSPFLEDVNKLLDLSHQMGLKMVDSTMRKVNISVMSMITLPIDLKYKSASAKVLSGKSSSVTTTKRKRLLL